jgi:hypothetical protein
MMRQMSSISKSLTADSERNKALAADSPVSGLYSTLRGRAAEAQRSAAGK